jgi:archaellum component FlaF (FlaF/FlaG flagellin family)
MKLRKILAGLALITITSLSIVSCQKEGSFDQELPVNESNARLSGAAEDDPALEAKVPLLISSDFLNNYNYDGSPVLLGKGKPDNIPPTVSIVSPSNGSVITGTINVQVTASDNVGVSSVSLSVDGLLVSSISTAPYILPWNSATVSNGTHTLMVTAKDKAGNSKAVSIQVSTNNVSGGDITNPTVSITTPSNNASVSGTIDIAANASDNIGVSLVKFIVDGALVGSDNSSPYSYSWNSVSVAAGIHTLTATATDAAGNAASYSISVTVNTTILPPPPSSLPSIVQLIMPPVGNQGGEGSCIAFTTAYGSRSCEQYYRTNATSYSYTTNIFSPEYVYNQTKIASDCGSGTAITLALDLMKNKGIVPWSSMPYSDANGCSLMPTTSQDALAAGYKIGGYSRMLNNDQNAIKTMLAQKHPVIASILIDNYFTNATPGFIWNTAGTGNIGHGLILCGYDDSKNAYKAMNSWGTAWGDGGYIWIDYNFFPSRAGSYVYVMNY